MLPDHLEAVCFDIGGVLVHPRRGFLAEELAAVLGTDLTLVRRLLVEHGKTRRTSPSELAAAVAAGCGVPTRARVVEDAVLRRQRDMAEPVLYPDAIPVLAGLRRAGWRLCFLSNAICSLDTSPLPAYLSLAEVVVQSWEIGHCKPAPEAFQAVERKMGLAAHQIVSVGDSLQTDVLGALAAGWSAVHVPRTAGLPPVPRRVPTITSLFELTALLPARASREAGLEGATG